MRNQKSKKLNAEKLYNSKFVKKILESQQQAREGKAVKIELNEIHYNPEFVKKIK